MNSSVLFSIICAGVLSAMFSTIVGFITVWEPISMTGAFCISIIVLMVWFNRP